MLLGVGWAAGAATPPDTSGAWQVTLLKPRDCSSCTYVEESLKRRGALQRVPLTDGAGTEVVASIERRASAQLTPEEWDELQTLPYFNRPVWERQAADRAAQILLKRDGRIVAAGNITDSTDLREVSFPEELTLPMGAATVPRIRDAYGSFYSMLFLERWNLDYFLRLALSPQLAGERSLGAWIAKRPPPQTPVLQSSNALLMSTGAGALENPIFNAIRSEEIEQVLTHEAGVGPAQLQRYYGGGRAPGYNAVEQSGATEHFVRRELPGSQPFRLQSLADVFERARAQPGTRNLFVFIGHGGPEGTPLWGSPAPLSPSDLRTLHEHGRGDDVLVSGNCYGGVMAKATSCGFFGARPDTIATGCQANAAEVAQSKDYLHVFFEALAQQHRAEADADGNGDVSFEEAHWYATQHGDERNVTYSTVDALAEDYFTAHPADLPVELSVAQIVQLGQTATAGERATVQWLTRALDPQTRVGLRNIVEQAYRYSERPDGARPVLAQLARRLLYTQRFAGGAAALTQARACGERSITRFLAR